MSTNDPFSNRWSQAWLDQQRQYWESWGDLSRRAMGLSEPPKPAWESALDHWWQAMTSALPAESRPLFDQLLEQGRQMLRMSEEWHRQMQNSDWRQAAMRTLDTFGDAMGKATAPTSATNWMENMAEPWQAWQSWAESLPGWLDPEALTRSLGKEIPGMAIFGDNTLFKQILSAPGVGYFREHEGLYKQVIERLGELRQALNDYSGYFGDLTGEATSRLRDSLMASDARPVEGARDLYNRWVDQCETLYAERVMTSDYQALHGRLVNAQMALRSVLQQMAEPWLHSLNLATATDLAPLQLRLQEVRRRERKQERRMRELEQRLAQLEEQLAKPATTASKTDSVEPAAPVVAEPVPKAAAAPSAPRAKAKSSRSTSTTATATARKKSPRRTGTSSDS